MLPALDALFRLTITLHCQSRPTMAVNAMMVNLFFTCILFCLMIQYCSALPEEPVNHEFKHVVYLQLNNLVLYKLASAMTTCSLLSSESLEHVLRSLLTQYHLKKDQINAVFVLNKLKNKIKFMFRQLKSVNRSGFKLQALMTKWENTTFTLKVPHRTGSPTKRKLENTEEELSRVADELTTTRRVLADINGKNKELERTIDRLRNLKKTQKWRKGERKRKGNIQ